MTPFPSTLIPSRPSRSNHRENLVGIPCQIARRSTAARICQDPVLRLDGASGEGGEPAEVARAVRHAAAAAQGGGEGGAVLPALRRHAGRDRPDAGAGPGGPAATGQDRRHVMTRRRALKTFIQAGESSRPGRGSAPGADVNQAEKVNPREKSAPRRSRRPATSILNATRADSGTRRDAIRSGRSGE